MSAVALLAAIPTDALPRLLAMPESILLVTHDEVRRAIAARRANSST